MPFRKTHLNKLKRRRERERNVLDSLDIESSEESQISSSKNILDSPPSMVSFSIPNNPIFPEAIIGNIEPTNCDNVNSSTTHTVDTNSNDEVIVAKNNPVNVISNSKNSSKIHTDIEQSPVIKQNDMQNQAGPSKKEVISTCSPPKVKKMDVCSTPMLQKGVALDWSIGPLSSDEDDKKNDKITNGKSTVKAVSSVIESRINSNASKGHNLQNLPKPKPKSIHLFKSLFRRNLESKRSAKTTNDKAGSNFQALEEWDSHREMTMKSKSDKSRKIIIQNRENINFDVISDAENVCKPRNELNKNNVNAVFGHPNTRLHNRCNQEHLSKSTSKQPDERQPNNSMNLSGISEKENEIASERVTSQPESPTENRTQQNTPQTCNIPKNDSVKRLRGRDIHLLSFSSRRRKGKYVFPNPQESSWKKSSRKSPQLNKTPVKALAIASPSRLSHNASHTVASNEILVPNCFTNLLGHDEHERTQSSKKTRHLAHVTSEPTQKDRSITQNELQLNPDNNTDIVLPQNRNCVILSDQHVNMNVSNLLKDKAYRPANVINGMGVIDSSKSSQEMNRSARLESLNVMEQINPPTGAKKALKPVDRTSVQHREKILQSVKKISKHTKRKVSCLNEEENYFQAHNLQKKRNSPLNGTTRRPLYSKSTDIDSFTSPQPGTSSSASNEKYAKDKADQNEVFETKLPSNNNTQNVSDQVENIVEANIDKISHTNATTKTGNIIGKRKALKQSHKSVTSARSLRSNEPSRSSTRSRHQPRPFWINECRLHYDCSGGIIEVSKQEEISNKKSSAEPKAGKSKVGRPKVGKPATVRKTDTKQTTSTRKGRRKKNVDVEEDRQSHSVESAITLILNVEEYQNQEAPRSDLPIIDEAEVLSAEILNKPKTVKRRAPRRTRRKKDDQANATDKQSPSNESATKLILNSEQQQNTEVAGPNLPLIEGDKIDPHETPDVRISDEIPVGELIQVTENAMSVVQETQETETPHEVPDIAEILQQPSTSRANGTEQLVMETTTSGLRKTIEIPVLGLTECFSRGVTETDYHSITEKLSQAICLNTADMQASFLKFHPFAEKKMGNSIKNDFVFYVLSGRVAVTIHSAKTESLAGEFFYVPRGIRYHIQNKSNSEAVLLCVSTRKIPVKT